MSWSDRGTSSIEPSIYAADFSRLGAQLEALHGAGASVFHFDVGDGALHPGDHDRPRRARVDLAVRSRVGRDARLPPDGRRAGEALRGDREGGRRQRDLSRRGASRACGARSPTRGRSGSASGSRSTRRRRSRWRQRPPRARISRSACRSTPATRARRSCRMRTSASRELRALLPDSVRRAGRRRHQSRHDPARARRGRGPPRRR